MKKISISLKEKAAYILSAGANPISSVSFHIDQMPEGKEKCLILKYTLTFI